MYSRSFFGRLATGAARAMGHPLAFLLAMLIIVVWAVTGPFFGYSDTWQLWIERPLHQRGGKERWTEADHAWLREHYAASTVQELEAQFPRRGYQAMRRQAETLGLKRRPRSRPKAKGRTWSDEEHAVLQAYAAGGISYAELCGRLPGRSWDAIVSQGAS